MKKPRIKFKKGDKVWVPSRITYIYNDGTCFVSFPGPVFFPKLSAIRRRKP